MKIVTKTLSLTTMTTVFCFIISVLMADHVSAPANVIRLVRQVDEDSVPGGNGSSIEYAESDEEAEGEEGYEEEEDYDEHDDVPEGGEDDGDDVEDEIENEVGEHTEQFRKIAGRHITSLAGIASSQSHTLDRVS